MPTIWFPDTTVICNFGAVDQIELLNKALAGRGRWTAAVAYEVENSARYLPQLERLISEGWLGDPIETDQHTVEIENIRFVEFGGTLQDPTKHLGEAQTCFLIRRSPEFKRAIWITDDVAAYEYGRQIGITTWSTCTVIENLVADGDISAEDGFKLLTQMHNTPDRYVHNMPQRPDDLR